MPKMTAAEALARATSPTQWKMIDDPPRDSQWRPATLKEPLLEFSEVAIARLRDLGFVIVPVDATKVMVDAGHDVGYSSDPLPPEDVWRAMIAAAMMAPDTEKGQHHG